MAAPQQQPSLGAAGPQPSAVLAQGFAVTDDADAGDVRSAKAKAETGGARRRQFLDEANSRTNGLLEQELRSYIRDLPFEEIPAYRGLPPPRSNTLASERLAQERENAAKVAAAAAAAGDRRSSVAGSADGESRGSTDGRARTAQQPQQQAGAAGGSGTAALRVDTNDPVERVKLRSTDYRYCLQQLASHFHAPYEVDRSHVSYATYRQVLQAPEAPDIDQLNPKVRDKQWDELVEFHHRGGVIPDVVERPAGAGGGDGSGGASPGLVGSPAATGGDGEDKAGAAQPRMTQDQFAARMAELQETSTSAREKRRVLRPGPYDMYDLRPRHTFLVHSFKPEGRR